MKRVYMDANATTPLLPEVFEAMRPYWTEHFGNASSIHQDGQHARAAIDRARAAVAELLNSHEAEIVFNSGGTEGDNAALFGLLRPGDHFVTTSIEHSAILRAAERLAERGVAVTFVAPTPGGLIDPAAIERALRPETRLISVMLANNETGVLQPVEEIGKIAKAAGAFFHIDAVQGAGKVPIDVRRIGCHLCSISAHKMHGPKGVGALFVRRGTPLESLIVGGSHERRRRAGTENVPAIVGFGKAAELAMHALEDDTIDRVSRLRDRLEAGLLALPGAGVNGAQPQSAPEGQQENSPGQAQRNGVPGDGSLSLGCRVEGPAVFSAPEINGAAPNSALEINGAEPLSAPKINGAERLSAPEGQQENSPEQAQRSPGKAARFDLQPRRGAANASAHPGAPGPDFRTWETTPPIPRVANTTNIWFDHLEGEALVIALDLKGIAVSGGSACHSGATEPSHVLLAMGLDKTRARSSLRFSLLKTATEADVDYVLQVVPEAVERLRAISPVAAGTAG